METEIKPLGNIEIHSIAIGVVGSGLQYHVGQKTRLNNKDCVITNIVRDESSYLLTHEIVYMIFGEIDGETKMIKAFINQPVYISVKV